MFHCFVQWSVADMNRWVRSELSEECCRLDLFSQEHAEEATWSVRTEPQQSRDWTASPAVGGWAAFTTPQRKSPESAHDPQHAGNNQLVFVVWSEVLASLLIILTFVLCCLSCGSTCGRSNRSNLFSSGSWSFTKQFVSLWDYFTIKASLMSALLRAVKVLNSCTVRKTNMRPVVK